MKKVSELLQTYLDGLKSDEVNQSSYMYYLQKGVATCVDMARWQEQNIDEHNELLKKLSEKG